MQFAVSAKNTAVYSLQSNGAALQITPYSITPNTQSGNDGSLVAGTAYTVASGSIPQPLAFAPDFDRNYFDEPAQQRGNRHEQRHLNRVS